MTDIDAQALQEELEHYRTEREKVRAIIGQIGGAGTNWHSKVLNVAFAMLVVFLFVFDLIQRAELIPDVLPAMVSLELAVLLVSIKIIWMIHQQARVEHFQFWILNSIEFRLTELSRHINNVEKRLQQQEDEPA